jgi:hypothetical protein
LYNFFFEYLKSNDPDKVVGRKGVKARMFIYPFMRVLLKAANPYKYHMVKRAKIPEGRAIIYAPTHGFKDDMLNSYIIINDPVYALFGSLLQFFNHHEGILAWLFGVILVDRTDKESKRTALLKMQRAMSFGINGLIFPEGTWNLTDSLLVLKLFNGIYKLAVSTSALITPVITHTDGNNCYVVLDEPFDITAYECDEGLQVLRDKMATVKFELMEKFSSYSRKELETNGVSLKAAWENYKEELINKVKYYPPMDHDVYQFKDKTVVDYSEAFAHLKRVKLTNNNAFLLRSIRTENFTELLIYDN